MYRGDARGARDYVEAGRARADDYYLAEGTGVAQWYEADAGGVVRSMGMLDADAYQKWVSGVDPDTGVPKGRVRSDPNAVRFAEVVVNGPKSWSLAAELHPDIAVAYEGAQDRAAEQIVGWMGRHGTARVGPRGGQVATEVDLLEAVSVRHYTNRAGDPHRHLHVQINARVHAGGAWRGIDTVAVRDSIRAVHGIGHAAVLTDPAFRAALSRHGFTLDEGGEITQLAPFVGRFSQRAEQIARHVKTFEAQWRDTNPDAEPGPGLRRVWDARAWAQDRPGKGTPEAAQTARARWVNELYRLGYTDPPTPVPTPVPVVVDAGVVDRDGAAVQVVARLGAARSAWNLPDVRGEAEQLLARALLVAEPDVRAQVVQDITARAVALCRPLLGRSGVPEHIRAWTSPRVIAVEQDLAGRLAVRGAFGGADAEVGLVTEVAKGGGVVLDERQGAAAAALAGDAALVVVHGAAGAGKTTTLGAARDVLATRGHSMVVVTPTLKAAKVAATELRTTTGAAGTDRGAVTVTGSAAGLAWAHGWRWDDTGWSRLTPGQVDPSTGGLWTGPASTGMRLAAGDLLVVDEAGMLDQDTARALLSIADEHGARVALLGDAHQLPAIGRGGVLDTAQRWTGSVTDLTVIHRFTCTGQIVPGVNGTVPDTEYAAMSLAMRTGEDPGAVFARLVARGQVRVWGSDAERDTAIAVQAVADRRSGRRVAVVVDTGEQAGQLNAEIRAHLVDAGLVDDTQGVVTAGGQRLGVGDMVATRRNDAAADVANRDVWTVAGVHPDGGVQVSGPVGTRTLTGGYVDRFVELAYACTAYGVQGDTTTAGQLVLSGHTSASSAYVGMTRGRQENIVHLVAPDLVQARQQWVDTFGRGRADLGVAAARTAAERAAAQYAQPPAAAPAPAPAVTVVPSTEQLDRLVAELHDAWRGHEDAQQELAALSPRLDAARVDAVNTEQDQRELAPLHRVLTATAHAAQAADTAAAAAAGVLQERAEQITADLRPQWEQDRPIASQAARVVRTGPGRLGQRRGDVRRATAWLDSWAADWAPVIEDLRTGPVDTTSPGEGDGVLRYAARPPAADRIEAALDAYAVQRARAELPEPVATVRAAQDAHNAAYTAQAVYTSTAEQLRQRALGRRWAAGWRASAEELPALSVQVAHAQEQAQASADRMAQLRADPLITARPDAGTFVAGLLDRWQQDRDSERGAAAAARERNALAQQERAATRRMQEAQQHYGPSHSPDSRGGPSLGR